MKNQKIKKYEFIYLKNDEFTHIKGTRKRNDIIYLEYIDGTEVCRIYLNNCEEYAETPYDSMMIKEISDITWTKDTNKENGIYVKSAKDKISFTKILERYINNSNYEVHENINEGIDSKDKEQKRKKFIELNPTANTNNK